MTEKVVTTDDDYYAMLFYFSEFENSRRLALLLGMGKADQAQFVSATLARVRSLNHPNYESQHPH